MCPRCLHYQYGEHRTRCMECDYHYKKNVSVNIQDMQQALYQAQQNITAAMPSYEIRRNPELQKHLILLQEQILDIMTQLEERR